MLPVDSYIIEFTPWFLKSHIMGFLKFLFQTEARVVQELARVKVLLNIKLLASTLWGVYALVIYNVLAVFLSIIDMRVTFFAGPEGSSLSTLFNLLGLSVALAFFFWGFLQKDSEYSFKSLLLGDENVIETVDVETVTGNKTIFVFVIAFFAQIVLLALQKPLTGYSLNVWNLVNIISCVISLVLPVTMGNALRSVAKYDATKIANLILVVAGSLVLITV